MDDLTFWQRMGLVAVIIGPLLLIVCILIEALMPWIDPRPQNRNQP